MFDAWFHAIIEAGKDRIVNSLFALAGSAMLTLMLFPVFDQECFTEYRCIFEVIEQRPAVRAISLADKNADTHFPGPGKWVSNLLIAADFDCRAE